MPLIQQPNSKNFPPNLSQIELISFFKLSLRQTIENFNRNTQKSVQLYILMCSYQLNASRKILLINVKFYPPE